MAELNSTEQKIEDWWGRIRPALDRRTGTIVRDLLRDASEDNKRVFQALYWRVNNWLMIQVGRDPLTDQERKMGFERSDVGEVRLPCFLYGKITGDWWQTHDLPRLLSELNQGFEPVLEEEDLF